MTLMYPGAPATTANGYALTIPTPSVSTYSLANGLTGSLSAY